MVTLEDIMQKFREAMSDILPSGSYDRMSDVLLMDAYRDSMEFYMKGDMVDQIPAILLPVCTYAYMHHIAETKGIQEAILWKLSFNP